MNYKNVIVPSCMMLIGLNVQASAIYCQSGGGYIKIGMTQNQVIQACGQPNNVEKKKTIKSRRVATQQLIYNVGQGTGEVGFAQPVLSRSVVMAPLGDSQANMATGQASTLMINIIAKKVASISLNGQAVNGASVCPNGSIEIGSSVNQVAYACGVPSVTNNSYKKIYDSAKQVKQEIWTVKASEYSTALKLTFDDGILQSIQQ